MTHREASLWTFQALLVVFASGIICGRVLVAVSATTTMTVFGFTWPELVEIVLWTAIALISAWGLCSKLREPQ